MQYAVFWYQSLQKACRRLAVRPKHVAVKKSIKLVLCATDLILSLYS
jgi:hypothetical protein